MSAPPLLIPTGDPAGVGPTVTTRAVANLEHTATRFVLFGDEERLAPGLSSNATVVHTGSVSDQTVSVHAPTAEGGLAQLAALDAAIDVALAGGGRAIVTAPTCKEAVHMSGSPFVGQTEHLARRCGLADDDVTMLFLGPRLRVGLVTTHVSLRDLPDAITPKRVRRTCEHLREALRALGISEPRVVVAGLNPHAGEGGLFGLEEREVIEPVARQLGVTGPIGAETAFRLAAAGQVHGVVAMYHDQATIASKLLDWERAVNVTWGLPFLRTSVDHGAAFDAAAAGSARADGMGAAIDLALRLTASGR